MTEKKKFIWFSVLLAVLFAASVCVIFLYAIPQYKKRIGLALAVQNYKQAKLDRYNQENNSYADYEVDVAFLGDSLTDMYNVEQFYPQYKVVNRGIGGDTTFDLQNRLQVSAYDLKPKVVVMLIGANNIQTMFENYEDIVIGLKTNLPNTKIVLLSLTSMSGTWGHNNQIACFNNVKIELIAKKHNCTFIDLYNPLFNLETNSLSAEYTIDGGHLTEQGYWVVTNTITPVLEGLL